MPLRADWGLQKQEGTHGVETQPGRKQNGEAALCIHLSLASVQQMEN